MQRLVGQPPVFRARLMFPNDGPIYRLVEAVDWPCPPEHLDEAARIIAGGFRSAPADTLASALVRLRFRTAGREPRSREDQEAEYVIWIEDLQRWPGDIVLDVLARWHSRPDGKWWPTWHDVEAAIQQKVDQRMALANHVRRLLDGPPLAIEAPQPATQEERTRAVERWERERKTLLRHSDAPSVARQLSPEQTKALVEEKLARMAAETKPLPASSEQAA